MLSQKESKIMLKMATNQKELTIVVLKQSRKKSLILEEKIKLLCTKGWLNPKIITEELNEDYDYVRRKMNSMNKRELLDLRLVKEGNTTKRFYRKPIIKEMKEYGVERFPFTSKAGRKITEPMFRSLLFSETKKMFEKAGFKLGM